MHHLLFLFILTASAHAAPWEKIFRPLDHWKVAQSIEVKDKSLIIQPGEKASLFTNATDPRKSGYLQTVEKYGDCTVETEFLIPKGSNSGIYLQGRYEIQILDSHGKAKVGDGDMGAVYHRWDEKRTPKGYEGHAPTINAAKPAGEWQKLVINFRAPRLDDQGNVLEKPRFISVHLNGKLVQKNITVHGPTRAAQRRGFNAKDHIFIQGDHGPIAFRLFKVTVADFSKATE